jgi:TatD DNase family protein
MAGLIDTHCHIQSLDTQSGEASTRELWSKAPELTLSTVLTAAGEVDVKQLICVGCDLADSKLAIDCAAEHDNLLASIGLHPHEADKYAGNREDLLRFADLVDQPKVVAVGECGLDYFYMHSNKEAQEAVLRFQLELALNQHLPVIFHVRDAFPDFWPIFDSYKGIRGVLHSYTDSKTNLHEAVERGLCIGVNGIATFAKRDEQLDVYKSIPLTSMVLETDSPFLTPVPLRGSVNQPKNVALVADFLSELRLESRETIAKVTTANARSLFSI